MNGLGGDLVTNSVTVELHKHAWTMAEHPLPVGLPVNFSLSWQVTNGIGNHTVTMSNISSTLNEVQVNL